MLLCCTALLQYKYYALVHSEMQAALHLLHLTKCYTLALALYSVLQYYMCTAIAQCKRKANMQKTQQFVTLQLLSSLWADDARWQDNVRDSVAGGYTLASEGDDGEMKLLNLTAGEVEFAEENVVVYDFAGSAHEDERFYARDILVYKVKATGDFCVLYYDGVDEF